MSKLNGKTLSYGVLHAGVHVPGIGTLGPTLSPVAGSGNRAVNMTVDEPYVHLEVPNKTGKPTTVSVPIVNFSHMLVKEDSAQDSKA